MEYWLEGAERRIGGDQNLWEGGGGGFSLSPKLQSKGAQCAAQRSYSMCPADTFGTAHSIPVFINLAGSKYIMLLGAEKK